MAPEEAIVFFIFSREFKTPEVYDHQIPVNPFLHSTFRLQLLYMSLWLLPSMLTYQRSELIFLTADEAYSLN